MDRRIIREHEIKANEILLGLAYEFHAQYWIQMMDMFDGGDFRDFCKVADKLAIFDDQIAHLTEDLRGTSKEHPIIIDD